MLLTRKLKNDKEIILSAVKQKPSIFYDIQNKLKEDTHLLIECYRINKDTIKFNDFIEQFDELENGHFDDTFIEENIDILHLVENKEQLCQYLLDNEKYDIIYHSEKIAEYIKENYNILIQSRNDLDIEKEYDIDELETQFRSDNSQYNVIFIL
jgi:hypothetical protein